MNIEDIQITVVVGSSPPPIAEYELELPESSSLPPASEETLPPASQQSSQSEAQTSQSEITLQHLLPDIAIDNERQREMLLHFNIWGLPGLRDNIYSYVKQKNEESPTIRSWDKMKSWMEDPFHWDLIYLQSMEPAFLKALMQGRVAQMFATNPQFRLCAEESHGLDGVPQVYINICCRKNSLRRNHSANLSAIDNPFEGQGYGPSLGYMLEVLSDMDDYLRVDDQSTVEYAKAVDGVFTCAEHGARVDKAYCHRVYLPSRNALRFLQSWVTKLKQTLGADAEKLDKKHLFSDLQWAFSEVGFGVKGYLTARMHRYHDGTNHLFGLFTACLFHRYPGEFRIDQYAILDVWEPEHADCCEILGSLLAGSYGQDIGWGLNPRYAGGAAMVGSNSIQGEGYNDNWGSSIKKREKKVTWDKWRPYHKELYERVDYAIRFDDKEKAARLKDFEELKAKLMAKQQEVKKLEELVERKDALREELRAALKTHQEKYGYAEESGQEQIGQKQPESGQSENEDEDNSEDPGDIEY